MLQSFLFVCRGARMPKNNSRVRGLSIGSFAILIALITVLSGCHFQFGGTEAKKDFAEIKIPEGFTFATSREVEFNLDVTYRADGVVKNYNGTVSILAIDDAGEHGLGSGQITSGKGKFSVAIPSDVARVAIRPDTFIMVAGEADLTPTQTSLTAVLAPPSATRSISSAKELFSARMLSAPDFGTLSSGFRLLTKTMDGNGLPVGKPEEGGFETARFEFKESFLADIGYSFPESEKIPEGDRKSYIEEGKLASVVIKEEAEVAITFISEGAGYKNSLGYYVRKTGDEAKAPEVSEIVLVFPNSSAAYSGGGLYGGDTIKLRNPVEDSSNYATTVFDAGYSIHWVLIANGFTGKDVSTSARRYYSIPSLNEGGKGSDFDLSHSALLFYTSDPYSDFSSSTETTEDDAKLVLGFEDMGRKGYPNAGDEDFNDCLFVVTATPFKNIDTEKLPVPKPIDPETYEVTDYFPKTYGTIIYEDLWPSKGDYDFNDMVVDFQTQTIRDGKGYVVKYKADFVLKAAGASIESGLAFRLPVDPTLIEDVKYTAGPAAEKGVFKLEDNGVEHHAGYAVVPVLNNAVKLFGDSIVNTVMSKPTVGDIRISIQVDFKKRTVIASDITRRTPDIFIVDSKDRTKEIHIIGKLPTSLAAGRFNTVDDDSANPLYYKDKAGAPWALMVPTPFHYSVEKSQLPAAYLHFAEWVETSGTTYSDWYNKDKTGYADTSLLYVAH